MPCVVKAHQWASTCLVTRLQMISKRSTKLTECQRALSRGDISHLRQLPIGAPPIPVKGSQVPDL